MTKITAMQLFDELIPKGLEVCSEGEGDRRRVRVPHQRSATEWLTDPATNCGVLLDGMPGHAHFYSRERPIRRRHRD